MTRAADRQRANRTRRWGRSYEARVALVALVAGIAAAISGTPQGRDAVGATPRERSSAVEGSAHRHTASRAAPARSLLLAHIGTGGRVDLLVGFAIAEGQREGEVLLVPPSTLVEVPSLGSQVLADVVRMGSLRGLELLHTSIDNALGVAFDEVLTLDDAGLVALLTPVASIEVDLRRSLRFEDAAGAVALSAGRQEIDSATAMRLLVAPSKSGEIEHLVAVQAVIEGWIAALRDRGAAAATVRVDKAARPLVVAARAELRYDTLPVAAVASGGDTLFALQQAEARALFEKTMPWALLGDEPRPRVEILNGTGAVGVTQAVAAVIVPEGVEVTLTGNLPGFGATETQVIYYRDGGAVTAQRIARALGTRNVARAVRPVDVVDVTVVVGSDFADDIEG